MSYRSLTLKHVKKEFDLQIIENRNRAPFSSIDY